jgi:hypothetical protein
MVWELNEQQQLRNDERQKAAEARQDKAEIRQQSLVDSIIQTNSALTKANEQNTELNFENTETLKELKDSAVNSNATVLRAVIDNSEMLQGVQETHKTQTQLLEQTTQIMQDAAVLMEPVPRQREEANALLRELLEEAKKKL